MSGGARLGSMLRITVSGDFHHFSSKNGEFLENQSSDHVLQKVAFIPFLPKII
jgi:hypothetical protein